MRKVVTHKLTHKASLFTVACLFIGEVMHVLEAAEHAHLRSKLVDYSRYT